MSYIEKNLMNGETVMFRAKHHWFYFVTPAIFFLFGLLFMPSDDTRVFGTVLLTVSLIFAAGRLVHHLTAEYAVTNKRVILKEGFIRRNSAELLLGKVEALNIDQSITGRIFGFGTVNVSGAAAGNPFRFVSTPLELRKHVYEQVESDKGAASSHG